MNPIEDKVLFEASRSDISLSQAKKIWKSPSIESVDLTHTQGGFVGADDGLGAASS